MNTKPSTHTHTQDNQQDFGVSPEDHHPLTLQSERHHTARKRALSAKLLDSVFDFQNGPDDKIDTAELTKLTNTMIAVDKSIVDDIKNNKDLLTVGVPKLQTENDATRLRVLAELCEITADIQPEDYDLEQLEALIKEQEKERNRD